MIIHLFANFQSTIIPQKNKKTLRSNKQDILASMGGFKEKEALEHELLLYVGHQLYFVGHLILYITANMSSEIMRWFWNGNHPFVVFVLTPIWSDL